MNWLVLPSAMSLPKKRFWHWPLPGALMLVYITFRFQFWFGLAAIITLLHDALIVLAVFSIFQLEISSSFIAAILTVVGYSINATIVVFDRVREGMPNYKANERIALLDAQYLHDIGTLHQYNIDHVAYPLCSDHLWW